MIGKEEDSEKMYHNADNAKCKTELRQLRTHAEEKKWENMQTYQSIWKIFRFLFTVQSTPS